MKTGQGSLKSGGRLSSSPEAHNVRIGIENCPMFFSADEWPSGKNLAISPAIWRRMFQRHPQPQLRPQLRPLPSGLAADGITCSPMRDYASPHLPCSTPRMCASTARTPQPGRVSSPRRWNITCRSCPASARSTGAGSSPSFSDTGYRGPVCVEVEDRAYEKTLALTQARTAARAGDSFASSLAGDMSV